MELLVELLDTEAEHLMTLASAKGTSAAQIAHDLLSADLRSSTSPVDDQTLTLLSQWAEEDSTDNLEELARRDRETAEFMANVEAARLTFPVRSR